MSEREREETRSEAETESPIKRFLMDILRIDSVDFTKLISVILEFEAHETWIFDPVSDHSIIFKRVRPGTITMSSHKFTKFINNGLKTIP